MEKMAPKTPSGLEVTMEIYSGPDILALDILKLLLLRLLGAAGPSRD